MTKSFYSGTGFFKTYEFFMLLRAIIVVQNLTFQGVFPKFSSDKMTWSNMFFLMLDPSEVIKTLAFQAQVFNTELWVQQMLMHRKNIVWSL